MCIRDSINIIDQWQPIIVFLSIASMVFGAIAAIGQKNLKRLIAYSSIGHMGYALAGLSVGTNQGIQSSVLYISIYLILLLKPDLGSKYSVIYSCEPV